MLSSLLVFALSGAHALQPPGSFHQGEAVARNGERWLALRVEAGDARMEATRLRVKTVFDEIVDADFAAKTPSLERQFESRERFLMFCRAVRELPLQCRRAFILKKVYGLSQKEIADYLGISESTVSAIE